MGTKDSASGKRAAKADATSEPVSIDYGKLFRFLPGAYIIFEAAEPHRFIEANDAHYAMTGQSSKMIGKAYFDIYPDTSERSHDTQQGDLHHAIDHVRRTGKPENLGTYRYDIPDGKSGLLVRFWQSALHPVLNEDGSVAAILQATHDVTEETLTEQERQYHQWQLEETLALGLIGTWQWDTESDMVVADKNLARTFGIDSDLAGAGIPFETFVSSVHPDDRETFRKAIQATLKKQGKFEQEYRTLDDDGNVRWVMARGRVQKDAGGSLLFPGVIVEITDRKQREELLRYQSLIMDSIDDAIVTLDLSGVITGWNKGAARLFGHSEKQAIGAASEAVLPIDARSDRNAIRQAAYQGGSWRGNIHYNHKDGHKVYVMASVSALRGEGNKPIGLVTIMQDQTEITKAQDLAEEERIKVLQAREETRRLKQQNEDLLALSRTKDEFIALTSHQLRTPATGTKQYLGMLLDGYAEPLGPRQRSYLQSAYDCNERQLRVVDDILRVAQVDLDKVVLRKEPTNMGTFLRQIIEEQTGKFEKRDHSVEYQQPATVLMADIDRDRLRMAIDNIIDNADKYTEPGKRIALRIRKSAKHVFIEVEDEGVGIQERDFSKLFQKFSRIDNPLSVEVGGSGLGLYWSERIIAMHGGQVTVRSEIDKGTVFVIKLPLISPAVKAAPVGRQTAEPARPR